MAQRGPKRQSPSVRQLADQKSRDDRLAPERSRCIGKAELGEARRRTGEGCEQEALEGVKGAALIEALA